MFCYLPILIPFLIPAHYIWLHICLYIAYVRPYRIRTCFEMKKYLNPSRACISQNQNKIHVSKPHFSKQTFPQGRFSRWKLRVHPDKKEIDPKGRLQHKCRVDPGDRARGKAADRHNYGIPGAGGGDVPRAELKLESWTPGQGCG